MHILNRIKLRTPESVELEFTLAGIGNRAYALIIDYLILAVTLILVLIAWTVISAQLFDFGVKIFGGNLGLWIVALALLSLFIIYNSYFVFFETLWGGKTIGKHIAKIQVVTDDGKPIGLREAALRAILRPIDEFLFIGAFLITINQREKRLGDLLAGTIVIQSESNLNSAKLTTLSITARSFYPQLRETAELSNLLPDDFMVIRDYLIRRRNLSPKAKALISLRLAEQLQKIICLDTLPPDIPADVFLEAIYLTYQKPDL